MSLLIFFNLLNCVQQIRDYLSLLDSFPSKDIVIQTLAFKLMQSTRTTFTGINFFAKTLFGILPYQKKRLKGMVPHFDRCIISDTAYGIVNKNTVAC